MAIDFTPIARLVMGRHSKRIDSWQGREADVQRNQLLYLLRKAAATAIGREGGFADAAACSHPEEAYASYLPARDYEGFRDIIMRMTDGEPNLLWPGECLNFAQSSGTTGGRSKYVPITREGLARNHYAGAQDAVGCYLLANPTSKVFSGKGFILGGSYETELRPSDPRVRVGDLSATLINNINPLANLFRVPKKETALLADWSIKLPALARESAGAHITNLSGVPSWFLKVLQNVLRLSGKQTINEVWPDLEVFFHGGISFEPYRPEYDKIINPGRMHYFETYNASEGFFAVQRTLGRGRQPMQLLLDVGVYYEFLPLGADKAVGVADVVPGKVYELIITTCNGLWRYHLGDTVRIESKSPLLVTIAGRTKSFINAFGEELMEHNAEHAIMKACEATGATVRNYTAAPVYPDATHRGCHEWLIEWIRRPQDVQEFMNVLDKELQKENSDYGAKRNGTIFLDPPIYTEATEGTFDRFLHHMGNGKLGGQRKIPRLSNDRTIIERALQFLS